VRVPPLLRALHALPPFPTAMNYDTANNGFIRSFRAANILSQGETDEAFAR
jgi:hypothetical protein